MGNPQILTWNKTSQQLRDGLPEIKGLGMMYHKYICGFFSVKFLNNFWMACSDIWRIVITCNISYINNEDYCSQTQRLLCKSCPSARF